jgi:hypothetical protein
MDLFIELLSRKHHDKIAEPVSRAPLFLRISEKITYSHLDRRALQEFVTCAPVQWLSTTERLDPGTNKH